MTLFVYIISKVGMYNKNPCLALTNTMQLFLFLIIILLLNYERTERGSDGPPPPRWRLGENVITFIL